MAVLSLADLEAFDPQARDTGRERRFCCPLPSPCQGKPIDSEHRTLSVNMQTGLWVCYRCGGSGKLRDHWTDRPAPRSKEARAAMARRAFALSPLRPTPPDKSAVVVEQLRNLCAVARTPGETYLAGRGVSLAVAAAAGVLFGRFYGRPAVVFPFYDRGGNLVALDGRYIDEAQPKCRTAGNAKLGVFLGRNDALAAEPVVVVESPICALSLAVCDVPAVALGGVSWPEWLPKALAFRRVAISLDDDAGGNEATPKLVKALQPFGTKLERWRPVRKDWNKVLEDLGVDAMRAALVDEEDELSQVEPELIARLCRCGARVPPDNFGTCRECIQRDGAFLVGA